jgi:subtilisin family serine protease
LLTALVAAGTVADAAGDVALVRVADTEMAATVRRLEGAGIPVLAVLPSQGVLVDRRVAAPDGVLVKAGQPRAEAWAPEVAISARLQVAGADAGGLGVLVGLTPSADWRAAADRLGAVGAEVRWIETAGGVRQLGVWVPEGRARAVRRQLRSTRGLVWADLQPAVRLGNFASVWRVQSGEPGTLPVHEHGVRGAGQLVAVLDTGLDADMCYFRDPAFGLPALNDGATVTVSPGHRKIHAVDFLWEADWPSPGPRSWDSQGHGTHVAGSVAGDNGADGVHQDADGMAPAARLIIQDGGYRVDDCGDLPGLGCPMRPLEPVLQQAWDQGARVHSNSWGDEENIRPFNRYTERTADIDRFVWEHPEMVVVAAAGNAGAEADTVGSPATGKNVLAVGAALHGDIDPPCVVAFSSRGWTEDGRIKPDVVAPGSLVISAASDGSIATDNCQVTAASGTSMACPTVAGLAALVRQYFMDGFWPTGKADPGSGFEPTSALVRAVLIASAQDMSGAAGCSIGPVPSREQGWGMVQLDTALELAGDRERLLVVDGEHELTSSEQSPFELELERTAGALKVVLVWTDPPSSSLASEHLINDLDLTVTGPTGTWLGNQLVAGASVTGGAADRVNPVEVVWLPDAAAGRWTVQVAPHLLRHGSQGFALVVLDTPAGREPRQGGGRAGSRAERTAAGADARSHAEAPAVP